MTQINHIFAGMTQWLWAMAAISVLLIVNPAHAAWQTPGQSTQDMGTAPAPQTGITTTLSSPAPFYSITAQDVGSAVAEQLQLQAVAPHAQATLNPGSPAILYSADHALSVVIHSLQIDPDSKRWQGQAYIMGPGKTETVKPVAGTYEPLIDVPVTNRTLRAHDVIADSDLSIKPMPERQLRKDTITDIKTLIGQSPRSGISAGRPIRQAEVTAPVVIKKGNAVELTYTSPYMSIKTDGTALEDGAVGQTVRVKNNKSEKAVTGRVAGPGKVEVNTATQ